MRKHPWVDQINWDDWYTVCHRRGPSVTCAYCSSLAVVTDCPGTVLSVCEVHLSMLNVVKGVSNE